MQIKPAAINSSGIETLVNFSDKPELIGQDSFEGYQVYLPGIWVPGHPELEEPFSVPIIGDNESTSLSLDWPVKDNVPFYKRIALTAMLPAEDFIRGEPLDEDSASLEDADKFDERQEPLNEVIEEYIGEWGGFLYAAVNINPSQEVEQATAEFIIFESSEDFETTQSLLETGLISAAEIVGIVRIKTFLDTPSPRHAQLSLSINELPVVKF